MSHPKWLIVFLIYADFRDTDLVSVDPLAMNKKMKIELDLLFQDILETPLNLERCRLNVIFNGIRYKNRESNLRIETKTLLYTIGRNEAEAGNHIANMEVIDTGDLAQDEALSTDLQNPFALSEILKKIKRPGEDEEVFFVTWDHGASFGIFKEEMAQKKFELVKPIDNNLDDFPSLKKFWDFAMADEKVKDLKPIVPANRENFITREGDENRNVVLRVGSEEYIVPEKLAAQYSDRGFREVEATLKINEATGKPGLVLSAPGREAVNPEGNGGANLDSAPLQVRPREILTNDELAAQLALWLEDRCSVLMMMNCWMMNLHALYSFREAVDFFIAPQTGIDLPGYNYKEILSCLNQPGEESPTPAKLADVCISSFDNDAAETRRTEAVNKLQDDVAGLDSFKIFAANLQLKENDLKVFDQSLGSIIETINQLREFLEAERDESSQRILQLQGLLSGIRAVSLDFSAGKTMMVDIVNWLYSVSLVDDRLGGGSKLPGKLKTKIVRLHNNLKPKKDQTSLLNSTQGKTLAVDQPCINFPPLGFSCFFPQESINKSNTLLISNVSDDLLLDNDLKSWTDCLKLIYPGISLP